MEGPMDQAGESILGGGDFDGDVDVSIMHCFC